MDIKWDRQEATDPPVRPACLVPGCTVQGPADHLAHDASRSSPAWAKDHGETADRVVTPDPAWPLILGRSGTA